MSELSIIGTAVAAANYLKKKARYEALKDQYDALVAAVDTYNTDKLDGYIENEGEELGERNEIPSGIKVSSILRVANLGGKIADVRFSVVLSNTGSESVKIYSIEARCSVFDATIDILRSIYNQSYISLNQTISKEIAPGETMEIVFEKGVSVLGGKIQEVKQAVLDAAGKKVITSCPKMSVDGVEKANVNIYWVSGNEKKNFYLNDRPGVLRYCGNSLS